MRAFWLVLVILAAGCTTSVPSVPTPTTPTPPLDAGPWSIPVEVTKGTAEPGLVLDNESNVWVHAPGGLWKSANGTKFDRINFGAGVVVGGDAELVIGRRGDLYYSDLLDLASLSVFSSHDKGKTWTFQPVASDAPLADRQWMITANDTGPLAGEPEAAYLAYNQLTSGVWVTKSVDGGLTWRPHLAFAQSGVTEADLQTMGNIVADDKGTLFVAVTTGSAGAPVTPAVNGYGVVVVASADGGLTWAPHTVYHGATSASNIFAILAVDVAGTVYATWSADGDKTTDVYLSHSSDKGATWSKPIAVTNGIGSHVQPWISAGDQPGELVLAWYEANETAKPKDVKGEWHVQVAYATNGAADAPTFAQWTATPSNHKGQICVEGTLCQGGRQLLDFFEVRLDPANRAHLVYADDAGGSGVRVMYVRSTAPLG